MKAVAAKVVTETHARTHKPKTVTLAAHAQRVNYLFHADP